MNRRKIKIQKRKIDREQFLELNYKEKVGDKVFQQIMETDPTYNKQYAQWIFNLFLKVETEERRKIFLEDLYKTKEDLSIFYKYKDRLSVELRDINRFKNTEELYHSVKEISANPEQFYSKTELTKEIKKEVDVLLDSEKWLVLIPKTKNTSILYGKGTRWCTASEQYNYFETYSKDGPLYIIIDKQADPSNKNYQKSYKHQFHFESSQFMDAEDVSIDYENFLYENPELLRAFSSLKNDFGFRLKLLFNLPIAEHEKTIYVRNNKTLDLSGIKCETLPENLIIHGSVKIERSNYIKYIKNLTVYGDLIMNQSSIERFEGKLHVEGKFEINNCTNLETLPENFYVGSTIKAKFCDLRSIPAGHIKGMAYFSENPYLSHISEKLIAEKNLYANLTLIPEMDRKTWKAKYPLIGDSLFSSKVQR